MMLEKLGAVAPAASLTPAGQSQALLQRMLRVLELEQLSSAHGCVKEG